VRFWRLLAASALLSVCWAGAHAQPQPKAAQAPAVKDGAAMSADEIDQLTSAMQRADSSEAQQSDLAAAQSGAPETKGRLKQAQTVELRRKPAEAGPDRTALWVVLGAGLAIAAFLALIWWRMPRQSGKARISAKVRLRRAMGGSRWARMDQKRA
jgi:hypothetical protein